MKQEHNTIRKIHLEDKKELLKIKKNYETKKIEGLDYKIKDFFSESRTKSRSRTKSKKIRGMS